MDVKIKLDPNFESAFKELIALPYESLAKLNGLSDEQLNYTDFIDNFVDKAVVADASIDSNANVAHKDIVSLENEMSKPHSKLLALNKIYYEINKKYGDGVAREWLRSEWVGDFYLHDAYSSSYVSYCFAYDIEELVNKGLYFIDSFNAQPPKHLVTYTDFVIEYISWCSNRTSGAVGIPSFLVYSYYFYKKDVENGYYMHSPEYYMKQEFQRFIYKLNQPYIRSGVQSAFSNCSIFDRSYLEALFGGKTYPDGSFIIDYIDDILEYQKEFMEVVSEIRSQNVMTFPVLTMALLRKDGKFVDEDFAKWCCRHNMKWADSNFFVSDDINSLSNCCRLKSNIEDMGYFNSIAGSALEVGSVKVNTINLAKIAYNNDQSAYITALIDKVVLSLKVLDRIRHIIQRNVDKGLLPNYELEIINMDSQYNTIGIIGIYEVLQHYGMIRKDEDGNTFYTENGIEFAKNILKTIHETINRFKENEKVDYKINIEQIPGERAASILMEKDKIFHPDEAYDLPLYGNQWIPLGVKCTLQEKIRLSAVLDEACSGGSIAHINIDAPFNNFDTAWKMLNYVADAGVTYFAFNLRISSCENNHGFYGDTCPICGKPKVTTYQRIVG